MTSLYPVKFQTSEERNRIRKAIANICRAAGFFSRHQVTVPSPPELLRFIAAHAESFEEWARKEKSKMSDLEEITVTNINRRRKWGWGWETTPTGDDAYSIKSPPGPAYEGTLRQVEQAIANDVAYKSVKSGGAFINTAWFWDGRRVHSTWGYWEINPKVSDYDEGRNELIVTQEAEWGWGWANGFHLLGVNNIEIRVKKAN